MRSQLLARIGRSSSDRAQRRRRLATSGAGYRIEAEWNLAMVDEQRLLARITVNADVFGGKPIIRGRRLAVEHVISMLAAGDTAETILEGYPWLKPETSRLASCTQSGSWAMSASSPLSAKPAREGSARHLRVGEGQGGAFPRRPRYEVGRRLGPTGRRAVVAARGFREKALAATSASIG